MKTKVEISLPPMLPGFVRPENGIFVIQRTNDINVFWNFKTKEECINVLRAALAAMMYAKDTKEKQIIEIEVGVEK